MSLLAAKKPLVDEAAGQNDLHRHQGSRAFYRAALPLSRQTLTFVSGIIRRHRTARRYAEETVTLLAARAPKLRQASAA